MRGNDITLMFVPHANERARRITISKSLIYAIISFLIFFIGAFIYLGYRNITSGLDQLKYAQLIEENKLLIQEFEKTKSDITQLRASLTRLAKFDNQLRVMAELPIIDDETRMLGTGGPDYGEKDPASNVREAYGLSGVRADLDGLIAEAQFQHDSFEKIATKISKNQQAWNHTPSVQPTDIVNVTSGYGIRRNPLTGRLAPHNGLDFSAPIGTPIYATADGEIIFSGRRGGYGNVIEIDHGYGYHTYYAHNAVNLKDVGDKVKRGDLIARVGNSGRSTGPHVHYEVRINDTPDNPCKYILNNDLTAF